MGAACCTNVSPHHPMSSNGTAEDSPTYCHMHHDHRHDKEVDEDTTTAQRNIDDADFALKDVLPDGVSETAVTVSTARPPPPAHMSATPVVTEVSGSHCQSPPPEPLPQFDPLASITTTTTTTNVVEVISPNHELIATTSTTQAQQQQAEGFSGFDVSPLAEFSNTGSTSVRSAMRASSSAAGASAGRSSSTVGDPPLFAHVSSVSAYASTTTYGDSSGKHSNSLGLADSAIQRHINAILNPRASVGGGGSCGASVAAASDGGGGGGTYDDGSLSGFAMSEVQRMTSEASGRKASHVSFLDDEEWKKEHEVVEGNGRM